MTVLRILGIDPGLNRCGWGIILADGARLSHIAHGVVRPKADLPMGKRLSAILDGLEGVIEQHDPHEAAVEETYVNLSNPKSALALGQARGAALIAPARHGLSIGEYAPAEIKKALVGNGQAEKEQVAFMVRRLMPAAGNVAADAADALAVAICHAAHWGSRKKIADKLGGAA
jgi:crossover junction endodeoxyribonuclease RuvC